MQCKQCSSSYPILCVSAYLFICFASCSLSNEDARTHVGSKDTSTNDSTWHEYLGGPDRNHYSTLDQITRDNVAQLQVAWQYATPDSGQMQMNAIVVDTMLYGVTAGLRAFALHAGEGRQIWIYGDSEKSWHSTSRGVSYWSNGTNRRILYTVGAHLIALDAITGRPIATFGDGGKVDLHDALPERYTESFVVSNTPGTVYKDLIIMPLRLSEGSDAAPGYVVAYDVVTGKVVWKFHTIPQPGESGYESWHTQHKDAEIDIGGANNWAGMAVDHELEIIYVPTGSAAPDFYGGARLGDNLYANCLLALDANTGERLWHYQMTHHDLWDRDPPAPPNLITVTREGKQIKAVAQMTKSGHIFLFDRITGQPLFDIEEVDVPPSPLEGEIAATTQPIPVKPKPFARQAYDYPSDAISPFAENKEELLSILTLARREMYAPPDTIPVFLLPGYDGGGEWGGAGADPDAGILYINSNEMAWIMQMEDIRTQAQVGPSEGLYNQYCASCHQKDKSGIPASGYPSLHGLSERLSESQVSALIQNGKGMMPGFPQLTEDQRTAILNWIMDSQDKIEVADQSSETQMGSYRHMGYNKFLDSNGLPAITPPWGTIHAIDMNTGTYIWSRTFGETPSLQKKGMPQTGCESYGGPIITANGLLIIAGTKDGFIRAFDRYSGTILWEYLLPAPAFATPTTYMFDGKQYIVVACGGEKLGTPKGNTIVAFALPQ